MVFAKKWAGFGTVPKLQEAVKKIKEISLNFSGMNNCIVFVNKLEDKDMMWLNICASYLADVCTMETVPVVRSEVYGQSFTELLKIFPNLIK